MSKLKNPDQRVGVFVDVQNLYYSAKALYSHKVNFNAVLSEAVAGRKLIRAIAYTIKAEMPEEQSFFDALESIGFEVKSKELQTFVSGQKKGDWDVGIAVDILKMAPKLDAIVLCSGDGDYSELLHHAKAEGCRAEVLSFGKSTSARLLAEVDDFVDMDASSDKFILNNKPTATSASRKYSPQRKTSTVKRDTTPTTAPAQPEVKISTEEPKKKFRIF